MCDFMIYYQLKFNWGLLGKVKDKKYNFLSELKRFYNRIV